MKTIKILAVVALLIISVCCFAFATIGRSTTKEQNLKTQGFAILELFTSEGCSSCPPADEFIGKIQQEFKDQPVYILAYHVDYWNQNGWKDPYSAVEYSNRQFEYSSVLGSQMYTPQVVLNGRQEFVGSDEPVLRQSLRKTLNGPISKTLKIEATQEANSLKLHYQCDGNLKGNILRIAIVQKQSTNKVIRGENGGRTLVHWQIVRQFDTFSLSTSGKGTQEVKIPEGFMTSENFELIGFIQNPRTGNIAAATKTLIAQSTSVSGK